MLKVLYIDDEPINLDIFYISFRRDFEVIKAVAPTEGLKIFNQNDIDVIVTDQRMPEMTGYDLIKRVKEVQPGMNCILLTAYYDPELLDDPEFQSFVFRYLEKPFKKEEMREIILDAAGLHT